jgi:hypothetical protein
VFIRPYKQNQARKQTVTKGVTGTNSHDASLPGSPAGSGGAEETATEGTTVCK